MSLEYITTVDTVAKTLPVVVRGTYAALIKILSTERIESAGMTFKRYSRSPGISLFD